MLSNEFYDIAFRKKLYRSLEELQEEVDNWLQSYNELRPHSGRFCYGKTPMHTFIDVAQLHNALQAYVINNPQEDKRPALEGGPASH